MTKKLNILDCPQLTLSPIAYLTVDPDRKQNLLHMSIADTCVNITNTDTGELIGQVRCCIGGSIEMKDEKTGKTWTIRPRELWEAFQQAVEKLPENQ